MAHDILIVDDEADIRAQVSGLLEDEGYASHAAGDSAAALKVLETRPPPALVLLDIWLRGSDLDGMGLLDLVRRHHPDIPVIMISGHGTIDTAVSAIKKGAYEFIEKPFESDRLLLMVRRALEAAELRREVAELRLRTGAAQELVGESPGINLVRAAAKRVAPTESRVFITGPAGSGKEVVARLIHDRSRRAAGPFVVVNAAMMRPDCLETELFGTEARGGSRKIGMFERAHGGTLFFDEIADMPLETQGKIVRVLQAHTFEREGGTQPIEVDVRIVVATTKYLENKIKSGTFREDLFYRLNVVPIRVPALGERREDIPALARFFMERAAANAGLPPRAIGEDAMVVLQSFDWPGNVRQLRNFVEWLLIMAPAPRDVPIGVDLLSANLHASAGEPRALLQPADVMTLPLRDARKHFEREYLGAQVARFGGNISRTAQFVGMERSALHRKLRSLGIVERERGQGRGAGDDGEPARGRADATMSGA